MTSPIITIARAPIFKGRMRPIVPGLDGNVDRLLKQELMNTDKQGIQT